MTLMLFFKIAIGVRVFDVTIQTHSSHGNPERVWLQNIEVTDDGETVENVLEKIGRDKYRDEVTRVAEKAGA